ncbi:hypothetical protein [Streptomyces sp. NRRL B-24572]|uniref:hypothetical protein n=1 Tax=Streptomyces sp. NRRL B-24572 TaxID=1962156 RepID=UPI000A3941AD|nr:hypothetical protein [Streptomyces sp. NRRL B-24572]
MNATLDTASVPATPGLFTRTQVKEAISAGIDLTTDEANRSEHEDRFVWASAAMLVLLDEPDAPWAAVRDHRNGAPVTREDDDVAQFTRDQVARAVDDGVRHVAGASRRRQTDDIDDLIVNATLTLLDDPHADFESIARDNYAVSPRVLRSWLHG